MTNKFKQMLGAVAVAFALVAFAAPSYAGISDKWCAGADSLCIGADQQTKHTLPIQHTRGTAQTEVGASTQVTITAGYKTVTSTGGIVTVSALPSVKTTYQVSGTTVASGVEITLKGTSDANAVVLQDDDTLAGSKLELGASTRALGLNDILVLMYDATVDRWLERSYSNLD